jgi:hypothetical protein
MNAALADDAFKAKLATLGGLPFATSREEFGQFTVEFTEKWPTLIRAANIKAE